MTEDKDWALAVGAVARMLVFISEEERTPVLSEKEAIDLALFVLEHELSERELKPPSDAPAVSARPTISRRGVVAEAESEVAQLVSGLCWRQRPDEYSQGRSAAEAESIIRSCLAQIVDLSGRSSAGIKPS